jgi:hypothetical protein
VSAYSRNRERHAGVAHESSAAFTVATQHSKRGAHSDEPVTGWNAEVHLAFENAYRWARDREG